MLDKALAAIAIAALIGFMGVLITYVREVDLTVVSIVVLIMAAYDFYLLNTAPPQSKDRSVEQDTRR